MSLLIPHAVNPATGDITVHGRDDLPIMIRGYLGTGSNRAQEDLSARRLYFEIDHITRLELAIAPGDPLARLVVIPRALIARLPTTGLQFALVDETDSFAFTSWQGTIRRAGFSAPQVIQTVNGAPTIGAGGGLIEAPSIEIVRGDGMTIEIVREGYAASVSLTQAEAAGAQAARDVIAPGLAIEDDGAVAANGNTSIGAGETANWTDLDNDPKFGRVFNRLFVGDCAFGTGNFNEPQGGSIVSTSATGPNWLFRDAQLAVGSRKGLVAGAFFTDTGMGDDSVQHPISRGAIAMAGSARVRTYGPGWCAYEDGILEANGLVLYGRETALKNKGPNKSSRPYFLDSGVIGALYAGGGDPSYGGAALNPNNCVMQVTKHAQTWNAGFVFAYDALTFDPITGLARVLHMGRNQALVWDAPGDFRAAHITSAGQTAGQATSLTFDDNAIRLRGAGGTGLLADLGLTAANLPGLLIAGGTALARNGANGRLMLAGRDVLTPTTFALNAAAGSGSFTAGFSFGRYTIINGRCSVIAMIYISTKDSASGGLTISLPAPPANFGAIGRQLAAGLNHSTGYELQGSFVAGDTTVTLYLSPGFASPFTNDNANYTIAFEYEIA